MTILTFITVLLTSCATCSALVYLFCRNRARVEHARVEAALRQHAEELARSNGELEQFAYISSHDLREPLRMVGLYAELLREHLGNSLDPRGADYLRYLVSGARRMQELISDLLTYSRVGKELSPFAEVDCNRVLKTALENLNGAIHESSAEVHVKALPKIYGNESQLTQLFQNLLGNAIKFRGNSPPNIIVSFGASEDELVFSVRDNGIGIPNRYQDRIFALFQRLHSPQKYPGTGIGLSICKRIVDHHGGRIWVDSVVGKGSVFHIGFPEGVRIRTELKQPSEQAYSV